MGRILHHHAPDASFRYLLRKNPVVKTVFKRTQHTRKYAEI
jgi:hypothetical protein